MDLARRLTRRVSHVYLTVGARLLTDELLEAAIGFPVLRKRDLTQATALQRAGGPGRGGDPRHTKAPAS